MHTHTRRSLAVFTLVLFTFGAGFGIAQLGRVPLAPAVPLAAAVEVAKTGRASSAQAAELAAWAEQNAQHQAQLAGHGRRVLWVAVGAPIIAAGLGLLAGRVAAGGRSARAGGV